MKKYLTLGLASIAISLIHGCAISSPTTSRHVPNSNPVVSGVKSQAVNIKPDFNCTLPDHKPCASIHITTQKTNIDWINQILNQRIAYYIDGSTTSTTKSKTPSIQSSLQQFILASKQDFDNAPHQQSSHTHLLTIDTRFLDQHHEIAVFRIDASQYTGGAHGSAASEYLSMDLKLGRQLTLDDLLLPNQKAAFEQAVRKTHHTWLEKQVQQNEIDDLSSYQQMWPFEMSHNFRLTAPGLALHYGQYAIGPYSIGMPKLLVPWEDLETIIKEKYRKAVPYMH